MSDTIAYSSFGIANRVWIHTALSFAFGVYFYYIINQLSCDALFSGIGIFIAVLICAVIGSLPALFIIEFFIRKIRLLKVSPQTRCGAFITLNLFITLLYGVAAGLSAGSNYNDDYWLDFFKATAVTCGVLFGATAIAVLINHRAILLYFSANNPNDFQQKFFTQSNTTNMEQREQCMHETNSSPVHRGQSKTLIKAGITALLILLMLIPASFVQSLITERRERQEQIVTEVSSKWASAQTITTPYIVIPYYTDSISRLNKNNLVLLPGDLTVKSNLLPVERARSIYNVLLYKSDIDISGNFHFALPKDLTGANLLLGEAKLCVGISDFKGIEQQVTAHIGDSDVTLNPGLPVKLDNNGLSALLEPGTAPALNTTVPFRLSLRIRGSKQLHFIPLSTNSNFDIQSSWQNPSFDGNVIPADKVISTDKPGFAAHWSFNSANLPFTNVLQGDAIKPYNNLAFGVSLLQPADQYAKTMRSVKYAVLVIGLTFALFFIVELLQRRPVHPVQYVLVGLALVIFYALLVSVSEFILFEYAYAIAAVATVTLITLYTKSHFKTWKTAGVFFGVLAGLYAFIYVLISLEDTALLVGSIALFIVLAIVMYASRKINWYQPLPVSAGPETVHPPS